ncbi:hypothetical protein [Paenibacillus elgii]|nr:hypothetical protein [Paenibacillus elgii]
MNGGSAAKWPDSDCQCPRLVESITKEERSKLLELVNRQLNG